MIRHDRDKKEKERKSIYIAPFCIKVHTKRSGMDHTVLPANNTMPARSVRRLVIVMSLGNSSSSSSSGKYRHYVF